MDTFTSIAGFSQDKKHQIGIESTEGNSEIKSIPFKENENKNSVLKVNNLSSTFYEMNDIPEERVREYYWRQYATYFYRGSHLNERFVGENANDLLNIIYILLKC
jgi:hypothetical protein